MPRNCCVPLCSTNASKDPQIRYHEFPSNAERRAAWLRNISREGPGGKGTVWQPNDRSLVCALHFTEQDYKKTEKLRILLPTAVPTVFPGYPSYMRTRSTPAPRKKRPRLEIEDDNAQSRAKCSGNAASKDRPVISQNGSSSDSTEATTPNNSELGNETCVEIASFSDASCQTTFDLVKLTEEAKKNALLPSEDRSYERSTAGPSRKSG